ncbi:hypothetical protein [Granulicella sibirica]|uniref:Uncharacterized protein n=1 Tax=Granulicella sibirica TaxID=2479048 RepID=A0A4Q0SYI0_9BACT|nr:hypothetical protein [Granulicella sibirica]RXH55937.1 hypothetical protein GRAN_2794 [Granulicella sibirica]
MSRRRLIRHAQKLLAAYVPVLLGAGVLTSLTGCGSGIAGSPVNATSTAPTSIPSAVKSGPQLGYIWSDKTHTLRPVLGIPGSSRLGESVVPADLYLTGASSAVSNLAILQETDGVLDLMSLPSGSPVRLSATLAPNAQIRFAPSGNNAVAFVPGTSSVTLLTTLGSSPKAQSVAFNSAIAEAAVSDSATVAAALSSGSIRTISLAGTPNTSGSVATLGGLSFVGTTENLLFADAASNSVTMVSNSTTSPASTLIPSASMLKSPQGLGATHDGHYAILANTGNASIVRVDLTAQTAPQSFACSCQPALVAQLSGSGVFRVTSADSGPAWMLDASASIPRVLFIPAINAASTSDSGTNTTVKN